MITLPLKNNYPQFPEFDRSASDPFLKNVEASGKKWTIITDPSGEPKMVLDTDGFLRAALFDSNPFSPYMFCHRPILIKDSNMLLGHVIGQMKVVPEDPRDDVIDQDIILVWGDEKRVITGSDILGRLLRGIATRVKMPYSRIDERR